MTIKVSAFKWVPPFAQGSVRDLRVRWALEEVGIGYEERLLEQGDQVNEKARGLQPFGQVPVYQEDGLTLFESGAIVLHIAGKSDALMPSDPHTRARMTTWMFAALNSIEPVIGNLTDIDFFSPEEEWAKLHRPAVVEAVNKRLADLSCWLDGKEYLEDRLHRGGHPDDHSAARPAPHRYRRGVPDAQSLSHTLRGTARLPESAGRSDGGLRPT